MKHPWAAAFKATALTSLLFVVAYNACNQLTHVRPDVGVWAFAWERAWPVVPAMIVPYWSIDLLFVLAPFLCLNAEEVAVHRRRIVFVIAGGALGFLLIPLRFAFARPEVHGFFAPWFTALYTFDYPHNLFPSLHIALRTLLADFYVRHSRGAGRWLVHGWFSLIGVSTLLTWQHHLVDVVGGFWLAGIALHLFRFDEPAPPRARNVTVAVLYGLGAVACTQLARLSWPWSFLFIWPAFALGTAAFGYSGHGSIYRKVEGRLTWTTKLLFAPLLAGQWISWWYYRRQSAHWSELTPRVWLGPVLRESEARAAAVAGVTAVLDLTVEFSRPRAFEQTRYLNLPVLDLTAPNPAQLAEAVAFIERESAAGIVFIHCKAGYSRTAGAAAAWLVSSGRATAAPDAFAQLVAVRPRIVIRPEIHAALAGNRPPA
jgi:protein-tyrosine phosphatase/membrane-associated phospholipid phosphatase